MSLLSNREIAGYLGVVDRVPEKERVKIRQLLECSADVAGVYWG